MLIPLEQRHASSTGFACQHQNFLVGYRAGQLGKRASDLDNRIVRSMDLLIPVLPEGSMHTSSLP